MRIDVIFDTVCPWCFVGKRRLERALLRRPNVSAQLHWRPFLLNPDMPEGGISRKVYLERKFGGPARVSRMLAGLKDAGRSEGIAFDFDAITRTPSSVDAHRLVRYAAAHGDASPLVDALFSAYFLEGRDIGERGTLASIAADLGFSFREVLEFLCSEEGRSAVFIENAHTHRMSINGVPCFIFDGTYGIAGAQEPDILTRMIDMAAEGCIQQPLSQPRPAKPSHMLTSKA